MMNLLYQNCKLSPKEPNFFLTIKTSRIKVGPSVGFALQILKFSKNQNYNYDAYLESKIQASLRQIENLQNHVENSGPSFALVLQILKCSKNQNYKNHAYFKSNMQTFLPQIENLQKSQLKTLDPPLGWFSKF